MTIKRFIILSVLLHAVLIAVLIYISKHMPPQKMPQSQLTADLVSPDQLKPLPPLAPATLKPLPKPQPKPQRPFMPPQRLPKLPPPTRKELEKMPLNGMPKPKSAAVRQSPKAPSSGKPAEGGKPSNQPGYEASNSHNNSYKSKRNNYGFNPLLALNQAAAGEVYRSEEKHSKSKSEIGFDTGDMKYIGYMQRLKEKIEGAMAQTFPWQARLSGDLDITFTINKDGSLGEVKMTRSSGYSLLDKAALRALNAAAPYWPLPSSWGQDKLVIPATFVYEIGGIGLR